MPRRFFVESGSLTDGSCDVLINAGNTNMKLGSGVSGALRTACGAGYQEYLFEELRGHCVESLLPGQVLMTSAGNHPTAKYVAHAAVMDYRKGFTGSSYPSLELVAQSYASIWEQVAMQPETSLSVAVVALGGGTGQLGARGPMEKACLTLRSFLAGPNQSSIGDVTFYGYTLPEYIATIEVVSQYFRIPRESLPSEVIRYLATGIGERS